MARASTATAQQLIPLTGCAHRDPGDDFFCLRYRVWYSSLDCAFRTRFKTAGGCLECEQGRFNLKRHSATLSIKPPYPPLR